MILLVQGFGKTFLCRELYKITGRYEIFSFNDGVDEVKLASILQNYRRAPQPVIIITGDESLLVYAERMFRANGATVIRVELLEPAL